MSRVGMLICVAVALAASSSAALGASGGAQWSRDKQSIVAQKDVGNERWSVTLNLNDLSVTGNVFFSDGRPPSFVACDETGVTRNIPDLTIIYRCFGSQGAQTVFDSNDWVPIADNVPVSASFFGPTPSGSCDLSGALNGSDADHATSVWDCSGINPPDPIEFELGVFGDGTGFTSDGGSFAFDQQHSGCGFGALQDGSTFSASYSPSRDVLSFLFLPASAGGFSLSECHRQPLPQ